MNINSEKFLCRTRGLLAASLLLVAAAPAVGQEPLFHDSHFHLTNYVQEGTEMADLVDMMGATIGRSTVFGLPLQQMWFYGNTGDYAPTYDLQTDAPLYYYSFTDAHIAMAYKALPPEKQARLDPMITGFNPADMYAADHIRRVLETFPGVFSGIGEFTIHKEFVSAKVAGDTASLTDPALDRILELSAEAGLVVILHCDLDVPFAKTDMDPVYMNQIRDLLRRHPEATIIWAHIGMGRVVRPVASAASVGAAERPLNHLELVEAAINDPTLGHVVFDISWSEVAKYIVATPEGMAAAADIVNRHPERFLFGTDEVAPTDQETYLSVYRQYAPFWEALTPAARAAVTKGNFERLFDEARTRVRAWEAANVR